MKVVFLGRYDESEILTGPDKVAKRIFNEHSKKYKTYFLEYYFDGAKYGFFKKIFGKEKICEVNKGIVYRFGLIPFFIFILHQKFQIIHIITYERFVLLIFLIKFIKKFKVIYNVHGIIRHENKYYNNITRFLNYRDTFCEKKIMKYSDILFVLSDISKKIVLQYYPFATKNIIELENGIDSEFNCYGQIRENNNNNLLKILFPSEISQKEKGFDKFFQCLLNSVCHLKIFIICRNSYDFNRYNNQYLDFNEIKPMTTINYAKFLSKIDIVVSPSLYETFGINVIENMATGVVPIVSEYTGASRFIDNEVNGFIVDFDNYQNLNSILNKLSIDFNYKKSISLKATRIYDLLSWDKVYTKYERIYYKLLSKKSDDNT